MSLVSIRIDEEKRDALKVLALKEGKSVRELLSELIEDYLRRNGKRIKSSSEVNLAEVMRMSEKSFEEWDNEEDEIYNEL